MFYGYNDGYMGLAWYEEELDREYEARMHGYETYEEYYEAMKDDEGNRQYDAWKDEQ